MKIAIIGYMGSGKTVVGKALSELTGLALLDLDSEIEKRTNLTIPEIFKTQGESSFRELETEKLSKVLSYRKNLIVACGGGVVISANNRKLLKENSRVVYLKGSLNLLFSRVKESPRMRPLIDRKDDEKVFGEIFSKRKKLYEESADAIIDIEGKKPEEIAAEIAKKIKTQKRRSRPERSPSQTRAESRDLKQGKRDKDVR